MEHLALYFVPSFITFVVLSVGYCLYFAKKENNDD